MTKRYTVLTAMTILILIGGTVQADIRLDDPDYRPSTGLTLSAWETGFYGGLAGYGISDAFQINLEHQAAFPDTAIEGFNAYNLSKPDLNFDDEECYIFNINTAGTGLNVYTYDGTPGTSVLDADIDWTITGWYHTVLAGYIDGNRLVVDPSTKYRPFASEVNGVEVFGGVLVDTEVIAYTFTGDAGNIGAGSVLGVQTVPVPGAVLLGAMGLGMVGWMKRRKKEA